ncbi:DUF4260 domain-containing protein [Spirochaeta cellobiosiphila]|uniref:DUF4260 domain-containing protein n=1 Tax=Spirochaeta cellobiosiphila TaxID=504483 RepID=UPI0003FBE132|nr:DUF4260 domain-containing protein [Spirochaeta cellobiosiphila]
MPKINLHVDGAVLFIAGLVIYIQLGLPIWAFFVFLLVPDLFMLGYLINNNWGARVYNIGHSLAWPLVCAIIGIVLSNPLWYGIALIWTSHIGMDHAMGYGFKYNDAFKHTHFSEV